MNTNGLSPLMQAAVGGEEQVDPTEKIYVADTYKVDDLISEGDLEEAFKKTGNDPKDYPQLTVQYYSEIREDENGKYVEKLKEDEEIKGLEEVVDPDAPGTPGEPGYEPSVSPEDMIPSRIPGGVGGPMQMASPYKNYKNPQEYKVFNFGNKPTPFNKYKKGKY